MRMRSTTEKVPVFIQADTIYRHTPTGEIVLCLGVVPPASPHGIRLSGGMGTGRTWNFSQPANYEKLTIPIVLENT